MPQHQTILRCSQTTATVLFILIGSLFLAAGCAQFYRTIGMSEDQVLGQVAADQQAKEQIIQGVRHTTTEIITTAIAGLGAIGTGILAKWLGTERKITAALITGVEAGDTLDVKKTIQQKATASGVETQLHKRVVALT